MLEQEEISEKKTHHHWKMRLLVGLIMLGLAFVGLIISDLRQNGAWNFWRIMVPIYAVLSLFLSAYLRKKGHLLSASTVWHELIHWFGLALAVYLVSLFVRVGLIGRFEAGLVVLSQLALTLFIAGIYVEKTFFLIGLLLGVFAAGAAVLAAYLYSIMIPLTIVVAVLLVLVARKKF